MRSIRVERTLEAPIEGIFDVLADHANYDRFGGIRRSALIRPGEADPNGVGALRRVSVGPFTFEEEITAFEPPTRMDYLIVKINAPYEHKGGSIRLAAAGEGRVDALWTSEFAIPTPVIGGLLERVFSLVFSRGFAGTLEESARVAAGAAPAKR